MAKVAGKRYSVRIVHGGLFVQGRHVMGEIDHDRRLLLISDEVPAFERLKLAEEMVDAASMTAGGDEPILRFHAYPFPVSGAAAELS
jgi:hypothetical protein